MFVAEMMEYQITIDRDPELNSLPFQHSLAGHNQYAYEFPINNYIDHNVTLFTQLKYRQSACVLVKSTNIATKKKDTIIIRQNEEKYFS